MLSARILADPRHDPAPSRKSVHRVGNDRDRHCILGLSMSLFRSSTFYCIPFQSVVGSPSGGVDMLKVSGHLGMAVPSLGFDRIERISSGWKGLNNQLPDRHVW